MFNRPIPITVLLVAVLLGAAWGTGAPQVHAQRVAATIDSTESVIDYTGSATMHDWTGTSRDVTGTIVLNVDTPDSSRAVIRAPVASFESGPDRRDRNMREVTEADQYPYVTFRTTDIRAAQWGRSSEGHAGRWAVTGDLTFHGQTHPVDATVTVRSSDDSVQVRAQFPVSLTRFGVERPELLWVAPIADTIRIDARLQAAVTEPDSGSDRLKDERNDATDTRRISSTDLRSLPATDYSGTRAGLHTEVQMRSDQDREWMLAFYGFTNRSTGLAATEKMYIEADGQSVEPHRFTSTTRELDDGTKVEIVRAFFSRPAYETIADALTVTATIGPAQFSVDWMARHDMRLLLDRVSEVLPGRVSSRDD